MQNENVAKKTKNYESILLRLSPEMKAKMTEHAKEKDESVNNFIVRAISETLDRETKLTIDEISGSKTIDLAVLLQAQNLSYQGISLYDSDKTKLLTMLEDMFKPRLKAENIFSIKNSGMDERKAAAKALLSAFDDLME